MAGMGVAWKRLQNFFNKQQDSNHFAKRKNINTKSIILIGETNKFWLKSSPRAYQPTWKTLELILSQKINLLRCLNNVINLFSERGLTPKFFMWVDMLLVNFLIKICLFHLSELCFWYLCFSSLRNGLNPVVY